MPTTLILVTIATLTAVGYILGRGRAVEVAEGRLARLHSVPSYHGAFVALWAGLPALVLLVVWILAEGPAVMALVLARLPESLVAVVEQTLSLLRSDILNLAHGVTNGRTPDPLISDAADLYNQLHGLAEGCLVVLGAVAGRRCCPAGRACCRCLSHNHHDPCPPSHLHHRQRGVALLQRPKLLVAQIALRWHWPNWPPCGQRCGRW